MAYMLPLRFIKVSSKRKEIDEKGKEKKFFDVAICATRITAIMSTDLYQARKAIHDEKKSGTLINACGILPAKSAIFLDNGVVVSSPLSVRVLMNAVERANQPYLKNAAAIEKQQKKQDKREEKEEYEDNQEDFDEEDLYESPEMSSLMEFDDLEEEDEISLEEDDE